MKVIRYKVQKKIVQFVKQPEKKMDEAAEPGRAAWIGRRLQATV